jgi:hypothetical protein
MSLRIDTDRVVAVLLPDGWHEIEDESFDLDAYEFVEFFEEAQPGTSPQQRTANLVHGGGDATGVTETGYTFREGGFRVSGPLTAVLAVREEPRATSRCVPARDAALIRR